MIKNGWTNHVDKGTVSGLTWKEEVFWREASGIFKLVRRKMMYGAESDGVVTRYHK